MIWILAIVSVVCVAVYDRYQYDGGDLNPADDLEYEEESRP